jgi:nucleotide-binding universal stress UspA family protein
MKSILVPIEKNDSISSMLRCATHFANRFQATIEGVALRLPQIAVVGPDPVVTVAYPKLDQEDRELAVASRRLFDAHFAGAGSSPSGEPAPRTRWRPGDPIDDAMLGSMARVYDATVVGRPTGTAAGPRMTTLEAALFDSGRPILIAPPEAPGSMGERIVISWNCSTESARTVAYALPYLKLAKEVTVLTIDSSVVPGPSGQELADYLAIHGINARELTVSAGGRRAGEAILEEARRLGADLLIKGAYTQSRLRQMIFGGATSDILSKALVPVFMAH